VGHPPCALYVLFRFILKYTAGVLQSFCVPSVQSPSKMDRIFSFSISSFMIQHLECSGNEASLLRLRIIIHSKNFFPFFFSLFPSFFSPIIQLSRQIGSADRVTVLRGAWHGVSKGVLRQLQNASLTDGNPYMAVPGVATRRAYNGRALLALAIL
jgi:hypothetical protein